MRDSDRKPFTLAANGRDEITVYGDKIFVESATFPFELGLGNGNLNLVKPGLKLNLDGELFTKIKVRNPSTTAALDGAIWVGTGFVDFLFPFTPPTALRPSTSSFSGGNKVTFPGIARNAPASGESGSSYTTYGIAQGNRRKQFVVSNKTATDITIYTSDDIAFAVVSPNSDYTLETDATFKIGGTNGNAWYVAELFYL